ncbi:hypothetical protein PPN31119_01013 [Pandoraea pnomenusa]|jgi:hypothetical protein|uniref:Uncharacterized protein n=2 Tax=Pandoraea TaxID=93217 RepID=A0A378YBV9_9BURK|nr:Uncharacterised protein [Pandoraea pnomenusa]VVD63494.1 hypothetical protein PMO31116_00224 [Pandoraea morbifera]VVE62828.1 hypothetical protein PPN31119_01013 [Pandoraea pnomenusa]
MAPQRRPFILGDPVYGKCRANADVCRADADWRQAASMRKNSVGVQPSAFRNMALKALVLS